MMAKTLRAQDDRQQRLPSSQGGLLGVGSHQSTSSSTPQPIAAVETVSSTSALQAPPLDYLLFRLLFLAESFLFPRQSASDPTIAGSSSAQVLTSPDVQSAAFYANAALALAPNDTKARMLLASCLLAGATLFPFDASSTSADLSSRPSAAHAHAALNLLETGPASIATDPACAHIYARACKALGRYSEAEEALAWALEADGSSKNSAHQQYPSISSHPVSKVSATSRAYAKELTDLGDLAAAANKPEQAALKYQAARELDVWNWRAWIGSCNLGMAPAAAKTFVCTLAKHEPDDYVPARFRDPLSMSSFHISDPVVGGKSGPSVLGADSTIPEGPELLPCTESSVPSTLVSTSSTSTKRAAGSNAPNPSSFVRPGSRVTSGGQTAASKRTRAGAAPAPSISATARNAGGRGTAAAFGIGGSASMAENRNHPAPTQSASARGSSVLTTRKVTSTLSSSRTNLKEEDRPPSAASTGISSRTIGSSEPTKDKSTPGLAESGNKEPIRRSARHGGTPAGGGTAASRARAGAGATTAAATRRAAATQTAGTATRPGSTAPATRTAGAGTIARAATSLTATRAKRAELEHSSSSDADLTANTNRKRGPAATAAAAKEEATRLRKEREDTAAMVNAATKEAVCEAAKWSAVDAKILSLLHTLGGAYRAARNSQGTAALQMLRRAGTPPDLGAFKESVGDADEERPGPGLEDVYRNTSVVRTLLGRVHHDMAAYATAEKEFAFARRLAPYILSQADTFSVVLFHLHREAPLSALAQELLALDSSAPEAHIAAGNAFALEKQHDAALRCFRRAALLAPSRAYPFTLAGYESLELDHQERALVFFRTALRNDRRHWNAWAGLGTVYHKVGKWEYARQHFEEAIRLNPQNATLWELYGSSFEALGNMMHALQAYNRAVTMAPQATPGARLRRAELCLSLGQHEAAHADLLRICALAPDQARVHLLLAHSFMRLGGGHFAELRGGMAAATGRGADGAEGSNGGAATQDGSIKAIGEPELPTKYQNAIAQHLAIAMDLDPGCTKVIRSMGEGAKAALRGAEQRRVGGAAYGAGAGEGELSIASSRGDGLDTVIHEDPSIVEDESMDGGESREGSADSGGEERDAEDEEEEEEEEDEEEEESDGEGGVSDAGGDASMDW